MKIRLFTHTDLDGSGCVVACQEAIGHENVEWSAHNYDTIDDAVKKEIINNPTVFQRFDLIFIADISPDQSTAWKLDNLSSTGEIWQFDHHKTRAWSARFSWVVFDQDRCGAKILYDWLLQEGLLDVGKCKETALDKYIEAVNAYDIWLLDSPHRALGESLNRIHGIFGQEAFLLLERNEVIALEEKIHDPLVKRDEWRINQGIEKAIRLVDENGIPFMAVLATGGGPQIAQKLLNYWPMIRYIAVFNPLAGVMSLYCRKGQDFDVSAIAKERHPNGGGHADAAGYSVRPSYISDIFKAVMKNVEGEVPPE